MSRIKWEWRKKTYRKIDTRSMPLQFYYLLADDLNDVTLAWECVPTYKDGLKYYPSNSYPCTDTEQKKLNQMRDKRLGADNESKTIKPKLVEESRIKLPF